jgi:hypothetical protein
MTREKRPSLDIFPADEYKRNTPMRQRKSRQSGKCGIAENKLGTYDSHRYPKRKFRQGFLRLNWFIAIFQPYFLYNNPLFAGPLPQL